MLLADFREMRVPMILRRSKPTSAWGPAQAAIREKIVDGRKLGTPVQGKPFTVQNVADKGMTLLLGEKEASTFFPWTVLEGALDFIDGNGWVTIGSSYEVSAASGTLDSYLKQYINRATAGWVAAVFEAAGLIRIDRQPPARVQRWSGTSDNHVVGISPVMEATRRSSTAGTKTQQVCPNCFVTIPTSGICGSCEG
jgi:hypothetical protein